MIGVALAGEASSPRLRSVARSAFTVSVAGVLVAGVFAGSLVAQVDSPRAQSTEPFSVGDFRELVGQYCLACHDESRRTAGLALDLMDPSGVAEAAEVWEKVAHKLRTRTMPPPGRRRPDDATYDAIAEWLEASLDRAAKAHPNPGRPLLHRMNRTEYRNAVRDLVGVDIDVSALPADDAAYGFDNIADALGVSPLLLESYVGAARKISRLAVGNPRILPLATTYKAPEDLTQDYHLRQLPLGTRGGLQIHEYVPVDGSYEIRVRLRRRSTGQIRGINEEHHLELSLDGERLGLFAIGGGDVYKPTIVNEQNPTQTLSKSFTADEHMYVRVPIAAGDHTITAAFVGRPSVLSEQTARPFLRSYVGSGLNLPDVRELKITGPFDPARPSASTASRARIFQCTPAAPEEELPCARTIVTALGRLAYRRPMTEAEVEELLRFYRRGRSSGDFESGIELALRFVLASPQFVFRFEAESPDVAPGDVYPVSDLDLASRLSFFLWSSLPDDELLTVAEGGGLREPAELEAQVERMLAHPRSTELVRNFAGQWLYLRNLDGVAPDPATFPDFDDNLRQALRRETELFFESILREDRSVLELMTADYTFVNERLARHYGIPGVYGDRFRRVRVTDENRRGLLGHGSILTVTSYATRTSPVLRGKWILENLLGTPPPPPPPDVPDLEDSTATQSLSMRERLAEHRKNPACASCHARMDPLGFALENFDAVGRWRTWGADGKVIDASDTLPDGTAFSGPAELREALVARPYAFVETLTKKLLTYALGRGLEHYDMPVVRDIVRQAAAQDYRFSVLISAIVLSDPFRMKLKKPGPIEGPSTDTAAGR